MALSNYEIIATEAMLRGFEYNRENLFTFAEWQERGYKVIKGQKALITTTLWKPVIRRNKETGSEEKSFIMVKSSLFSKEQVEEMSEEFKQYLKSKKKTRVS